jgi:hypothetical protein
MAVDLQTFFRDYVDAYNQALGDSRNLGRIRRLVADCFVAASPDGVVCGHNDGGFAHILDQGYGFYRAIHTRRLNFVRVVTTSIDDRHAMARVSFRADYAPKAGELSIEFDVTYILQIGGDQPKIFAFIAGDEMALYRRHGLVDEAGEPVP